MHKDDLIRALDEIKPDENQKTQMLDKITNHRNKTRSSLNLKILVPACIFALTILGTALTLPFLLKNPQNLISDAPQSQTLATADSRNGDANLDMYKPNGGAPEIGTTEDFFIDDGRDIAYDTFSMFTLDKRQYINLSDYKLKELGLTGTVDSKHIGDFIATIQSNGVYDNKNLEGSEVYEYIPAGSQAIVAVKNNEGYSLYEFYGFTSYMNNSDEDAAEYLKVYNIDSAKDISKIIIESYAKSSVILDSLEDISKFYDYFKYLKNSSEEYFNRLYNARINSVTPPDEPVINQIAPYYPEHEVSTDVAEDLIIQSGAYEGGTVEPTSAASGSAAGSAGHLLSNSHQIKIYTTSGLCYETVYYPNIQFISRHQISEEFANFLNGLINQ